MPRDQDPTRFADNFSRLLGVHNLTQAKAATLLELSPNTISSWMAGRRRPGTRNLFDLEAFFEVNASTLAYGEPLDLLAQAIEPERFERVEARIKRASVPLELVTPRRAPSLTQTDEYRQGYSDGRAEKPRQSDDPRYKAGHGDGLRDFDDAATVPKPVGRA